MSRKYSLRDQEKIMFHNTKKMLNTTEYDQKKKNVEMSQSDIVNQQHYSIADLRKAFQTISHGKQYIEPSFLFGFLQEQGESLYTGVEMVALLDKERKGHVTYEQFIQFFERGVFGEEPVLSPEMQTNREWVHVIDENYETMKKYADKEYCQYAYERLKEEQERHE